MIRAFIRVSDAPMKRKVAARIIIGICCLIFIFLLVQIRLFFFPRPVFPRRSLLLAYGPTGSGKSTPRIRSQVYRVLGMQDRATPTDVNVDSIVERDRQFQRQLQLFMDLHRPDIDAGNYSGFAVRADALYWRTRRRLHADDLNDRNLHVAARKHQDIVLETTGTSTSTLKWICSLGPDVRALGYTIDLIYSVVHPKLLQDRVVSRFLKARAATSRGLVARLPNVFQNTMPGRTLLEDQTARAQHNADWLVRHGCVDSVIIFDNNDEHPRLAGAFQFIQPHSDVAPRELMTHCRLPEHPKSLTECAVDDDGLAAKDQDHTCAAVSARDYALHLNSHCALVSA
jgi:hypothetical protein